MNEINSYALCPSADDLEISIKEKARSNFTFVRELIQKRTAKNSFFKQIITTADGSSSWWTTQYVCCWTNRRACCIFRTRNHVVRMMIRCFFGRRSHKEEALRGKEKGSRAEHNIAPQIQIRRVKKNCNGCPNWWPGASSVAMATVSH